MDGGLIVSLDARAVLSAIPPLSRPALVIATPFRARHTACMKLVLTSYFTSSKLPVAGFSNT